MEALLQQRSGLAEAGVDGQALLEGAATGTTLALPYCRYLVTMLLQAVTAASDEAMDSDQPQLNAYTVFCQTWHEETLARLSNADIANLWRLVGYLMLDAACLTCLEDVVVQRHVRSGRHNTLLPTGAIVEGSAIVQRPRAILARTWYNEWHTSRVARGLEVPVFTELQEAATWGHWDLLQQARAAGAPWTRNITIGAVLGGHLRLLQQLRQAGCPWDFDVVENACKGGHTKLAIWALENNAPRGVFWREYAALWCRPAVLQWARSHDALPDDYVPSLIELIRVAVVKNAAVATWLGSLAAHA
jgi:hypothetical protein